MRAVPGPSTDLPVRDGGTARQLANRCRQI